MIYLEACEEFKMDYLKKAEDVINKELANEKEAFLIKINMFLPKKESGDDYVKSIKELIILPFDKISKAIDYIDNNESLHNTQCFSQIDGKREMNHIFDKYKNLYKKLMDRQIAGKKISVLLVESLGITVCPYCNREFVNSRAGNVAGAEMDHFFAKSNYPFLALSLYNIVPSCRNCNKVKSNKRIDVSPFNKKIKDTSNHQIFQFNEIGLEKFKVQLTDNFPVKDNFSKLKIEDAYSIHNKEIQDLHKLAQVYNYSQRREIDELISKATRASGNSSNLCFKQLIFGINYNEPDFKKEPLAKFKYDILKQLKIIE